MVPPDNAVVLSVDEKTQMQALDRTQPRLPLRPGQIARRTHDYTRHGTASLYAAFDVATGKVLGSVKIVRAVPRRLALHLVLDNSSTHKTPDVLAWLAAHPRFTLHFTPTSASWLNAVEDGSPSSNGARCGAAHSRRFGMKIVVIGGTGLIGSKTVPILRQRDHEVVAASPNTGVNSITGEGLKEAMAGTQVVIDLANSPSFEDKAVLEFFETSGRNLLAADAAAGVRHHVALSIVGTDRSDNGYFRAKVAQEKLIETAGIPYTIIRSTQFMEFLRGIADSSADGNVVRISPVLFQPIAADDVAAIVAEVAIAAPRKGIVEIAGPQRAPFNEIVARYLKALGDPREVVSDPEARYFGGRVEERSLVPLGEARLGRIGLDEWLLRSQARA